MQNATLPHDIAPPATVEGTLPTSMTVSGPLAAVPLAAGQVSKQRRVDKRHDYRARIDTLRQQASKEDWNDSVEVGDEQPKILGFCAMMFVFGQIISLGALNRGHTVAFYIGLLFTAAALTLGLISHMNRRSAKSLVEEAALLTNDQGEQEQELFSKPHQVSA